MMPGRLVLLGHPVSHSVSPRMHTAALKAANIPTRYEALDIPPAALAGVLGELKHDRAAGNVTRPHKGAVFAACDAMSDVARRAGAVNTFWHEGELLHGDNTDSAGFDFAARRLVHDTFEGKVLLVGSGGAAAGVLEAISHWPNATVDIVARNHFVAQSLAERYSGSVRVITITAEAMREARLVVNATPIGQDDDSVPFDVEQLPARCKVLDLVYRRGGTMLVRRALARGLEAEDGMRMLVEQGALSFERWFGRSADRDAMLLAIA